MSRNENLLRYHWRRDHVKLIKKFPTTGAYPKPDKASPRPSTLKFVPTLHLSLWLYLQNGLFPSSFRTKILYASFISPVRVTYPDNFILPDLTTLINQNVLQKHSTTMSRPSSEKGLKMQGSWNNNKNGIN